MWRYRRTASGAKTTVIAMLQAMECQAGVATGPPSIRPRLAPASAVTGLTRTQACSQPGSVLVWMNTLLPNASGNMTRKLNPCRLCGDFTYRPRSIPAVRRASNYIVATTTHTRLRRCHNDVVAATRHPPVTVFRGGGARAVQALPRYRSPAGLAAGRLGCDSRDSRGGR